jgi:tripartite-type tricarboxylate transporter receptor subunit TctC
LRGLPEVPTFQKAGIKELVIEPWFGVFVPAGTPAAIVAVIDRAPRPRAPDGKLSEVS